jgi:Uma2 family endonuclease
MSTVVVLGKIRVPSWVVDLDSFCRWACSEEYPEEARCSFLNGEIWVDMSPERIYTHNQVKGEFTIVLGRLVKAKRLGRFVPDGMLLRNDQAGLSTEPDGTFISFKSFKSGRVRVVNGGPAADVLIGTPDMVLEVISDSSEDKDTEKLRQLYWEAGIPEYWLVDVREGQLHFDILRRGKKGYLETRPQSGWLKSKVFNKAFRLTVEPDELGEPEFTLSVR